MNSGILRPGLSLEALMKPWRGGRLKADGVVVEIQVRPPKAWTKVVASARGIVSSGGRVLVSLGHTSVVSRRMNTGVCLFPLTILVTILFLPVLGCLGRWLCQPDKSKIMEYLRTHNIKKVIRHKVSQALCWCIEWGVHYFEEFQSSESIHCRSNPWVSLLIHFKVDRARH